MQPRRFRKRSAFTLVEVLLVLVILGLLATVAVVAILPQKEGARLDSCRLKMDSIETALELYNNNIGHYPNDEEGGLTALLTKPNFSDEKLGEKWRGPYVKEELRDPWSNPFHYEKAESSETAGKPYKLWSNGPDGQDGTQDDLRNWSEEGSSK